MNASIRLLIADDDPVMRMLLGAIARGDPVLELVAEAEDADEAIALAAEHRPDVVLLDVEMPGGGGLRAAREIRAAAAGRAGAGVERAFGRRGAGRHGRGGRGRLRGQGDSAGGRGASAARRRLSPRAAP